MTVDTVYFLIKKVEPNTMKTKKRFIVIASAAGLTAFAGDFLISFILGFFYPNYNHLKMVMSELGTSQSPVAVWINLWWVVFGFLFIIYGIGFGKAFEYRKKSVFIVVLLLILFGLGAGIGAGIFPMDAQDIQTTSVGKLHDVFAGTGFFAIAFVPLISMKIFPRIRFPKFYWLSIGVFVIGVITFALFVISEDASSTGSLLSYTGLWQRFFLLNHYSYLGIISAMMIRNDHV